MAQFDIEFPEDLLGGLCQTDTARLCEEMIKNAAPVMVEAMKQEMKKVIGHDGESEMVNSVKAGKPKRSKNGAFIALIGPSGNSKNFYYANGKKTRKYKVSNVMKAIWLNYGRKNQPAKPFLQKAKNCADQKAVEIMTETYKQKTGKEI